LAVGFILGVQSRGVGASLKHYAANNQETERFRINAVVDKRTLREIYLPAFETAVNKAKPWTVMCAYNKLNGTYCSEHHELLVDILKDEWGFEGAVVSDWGAVHDRVQALQSGLDLEMPGPKPRRAQSVADAVRAGGLDEQVLNESVRRILNIVSKASKRPESCGFDAAAHHALARKIAADGIVLLKNNGVLPLRNPQRIAVIGRAAMQPHFQGGGSSHLVPAELDMPFDELRELSGAAEFSFCEGYPAASDFQPALIDEATEAARAAEVALLYVALPDYKESEGYDRADLDLTPHQIALIKAVCAVQPQTVVILNSGSAVVMGEWIEGAAAVIEAWMAGQAGGGAIADVLLGRVNPSGKLTETFPQKLSDTPAHINFPGDNGEVRYGEGVFIGYRYYDAKGMPVLFPFGHGLSYTTFAYGNLRVSAATFKDVDGTTISVDVTNTGKLAGQEIVQVYVHDRESMVARPPKELKGFAKVALQPGETRTVTIELGFRAFAYYHPGCHQWVAESGEFDILIGASASDIRCTATVTLQSTLERTCLLNRESTVREWRDDPRGRVVAEPVMQQVLTHAGETFGLGGGVDMLGFLMEMPLLSVLHFEEKHFPMPAEDLVDDLLRRAHGIRMPDQLCACLPGERNSRKRQHHPTVHA
jgi:beta-glucosidase